MKLIKSSIQAVFSAFGYKIVRIKEEYVSFDNFKNLSYAYEQLLNESRRKKLILQDELRPKLLARLLGTPPSEAYYIIESLSKTKSVDGDVCEFGVAQGETSTLIANEIVISEKKLHLFDSFEGLSKPTVKDELKDDIYSLGSMEAYAGTMLCPKEMVISRLKSISFPPNRYAIHSGFIEDLLIKNESLPDKVSFAYFDLYEPIKIALNYLHGVTQSGAIIIIDDYNYFSTGVKTAVDEFIEEINSVDKIYDILVADEQFGSFAVLTKIG